ncbi:MAG TPA: hypothetical protein VER79_03700 [Candidatus Limnocylindrales bacterium]|nr:hypothetical protein [Candidatus Limnocylindrales bacterium]
MVALLCLFALLVLALPLAEALLFALPGVVLHWTLEFLHHIGHAIAARHTGYPMQGIRFGMMGIVAMSVYPQDEPALPARIHIRRALGGPIISASIGLVLLALVVVAGDSASLTAYLLRLGLFLCFMMSAGALMPVPNLDGGTILYWARH